MSIIFPVEILEIIACSSFENLRLIWIFGLRRLLRDDGVVKWTVLDIFAKEMEVYKRVEWRLPNGRKHRGGDLPAMIYPDGSKIWYKNGKIHRELVALIGGIHTTSPPYGDLPAEI